MSRIGKKPIIVPEDVDIRISRDQISVKKGQQELFQTIPTGIKVELSAKGRSASGGKESFISVTQTDNSRQTKAFHGLIRSLIQNMITGVTSGFQKTLELHGTGYRVTAKNQAIEMTLGFSHPVVFKAPAGIKLEVANQTTIIISGINKQLVGQTAAKIKQFRPPDAYKGKGIRYQGEQIKLKPGKAAKAAERA